MDEMERRVIEIEENCKTITEQLTKGAVKFGRQDTRIKHLEGCVGSIKDDGEKTRDTISKMQADWAGNWNKILAGLVVACVLLALNAFLLLVNGA